MNLNLSWSDLALACSGALLRGDPQDRVASITTDTRRLKADQVFWALKGERVDGHDFLGAARHACGWVLRQGWKMPRDLPEHVLTVPDTCKALQALAAFHRRRFEIPIAAVAGSNGKTSTKEMLRSICSQQGPVCATEGNLNNQFGLPLSVLELDPSHRYGVFEMGESHPGDLDELTRIVGPTLVVLTNVAAAHLEFFGDLEGVFRCLREAVDASPSQTRIAVNLDDPWLATLAKSLGSRAVTYGTSPKAQVRLLKSPAGEVELLIHKRRVRARLATPGHLHRRNACAAAAAAVGMDIGLEAVAEGLEAFRPAPMRFEPRRHPSGAWLVLDAYNANPGSMRAGIESFCQAYPRARRILALGDMKELGPQSLRLHRELGSWIARQKVSAVFLAGRHMAEAAEAVRENARIETHHADDYASWAKTLRDALGPGAAAYFKASRAMKFEGLIGSL